MTIGEKIKKARIDSHMTQSEIAEGCISRNMMSKIENESVNPSLKTLVHIAGKLKLPVEYFLRDGSELSDNVTFRESEVRRLFAEGKKSECLDVFSACEISDSDEMNFIRAACYLDSGIRKYKSGRLNAAEQDFNSVVSAVNKTNYPCDGLERQAYVYLFEIKRVELLSTGYKDEKNDEFPARVLKYEYEQMEAEKCILALIKKSDFVSAEYLRTKMLPDESVISKRLKAMLISETGDLAGAIGIFNELILDTEIPIIQKFILYDYLEEIYAEIGNYTDAYMCARKKSELYSYMKIDTTQSSV